MTVSLPETDGLWGKCPYHTPSTDLLPLTSSPAHPLLLQPRHLSAFHTTDTPAKLVQQNPLTCTLFSWQWLMDSSGWIKILANMMLIKNVNCFSHMPFRNLLLYSSLHFHLQSLKELEAQGRGNWLTFLPLSYSQSVPLFHCHHQHLHWVHLWGYCSEGPEIRTSEF